MADAFGDGPVVAGPTVTSLAEAHSSCADALSGLRAVVGWPSAPRPVRSADLLPERALAGDPEAEWQLVDGIARPLEEAGGAVLETVETYLESGGVLENCARLLFVHPNTVRYRLRKATELTGRNPGDARDALVLRVALCVGPPGPRQGPLVTSTCQRAQHAQNFRCDRRHSPVVFGGFLQNGSADFVTPSITGAPVHRVQWRGDRATRPGQGSQAPGMFSPWLELDGARERVGRVVRGRRARPAAAGHHRRGGGDPGHRDHPAADRRAVVARVRAPDAGDRPADRHVLAGHSVGELAAAAAAGVFSPADAVALAALRGREMAAACSLAPTGMAAVMRGEPDEVLAWLDEHDLIPANRNGAGQTVAAGLMSDLDAASPRRRRA